MTTIRLSLAALALASAHGAFAVTYEIDSAHSSVSFTIPHLGISSVDGKFKKFGGNFDFDPAKIDASKADAWVEVNSVDTGVEARDTHLKAADFFDAAKYPRMTLKSKKVTGDAKNGFTMLADLTIHGVTKEVPFEVKHIGTGKGMDGIIRSGFEAKAQIDRFDFGLSYNKLIEAAPVIGKTVDILLRIEGKPVDAKAAK